MGPQQIDENIRQNRERYTREAIRQQLTAAGLVWLLVTGTCYAPLFT